VPAAPGKTKDLPRPKVRVNLHTDTDQTGSSGSVGPLKLTAYLSPVSILPLTSYNLIYSLVTQPFVLLLSMPRILYHAWILHYVKRLCVYVRPEPHPAGQSWVTTVPKSGGIGWQPETWMEKFARARVEEFLRQRVFDTGISVALISANPSILPWECHVDHPGGAELLTIGYMSSSFFVALFTAPSLPHALALCHSSKLCFVSSQDLFHKVLLSTAGRKDGRINDASRTISQRLRVLQLPSSLRYSGPGPDHPTIPNTHPLDPQKTTSWKYAHSIVVLIISYLAGALEKNVYRLTNVEFVPGDEPWCAWERAFCSKEAIDKTAFKTIRGHSDPEHNLGSVRRNK
jgi:hypothetical protein